MREETDCFYKLNLKFCEFKLSGTGVVRVSLSLSWAHNFSHAAECDLMSDSE